MSARRNPRSRNGRAGAPEKSADRDSRQAQEVERLKHLREELAKRDRQIADLERQLALRQQNSTTSSKPPSSDGLAGRERETDLPPIDAHITEYQCPHVVCPACGNTTQAPLPEDGRVAAAETALTG